MQQQLQYIISITLLFFCIPAFSQDTTKIIIDAGPSIYVDYGKLLTLPMGFETKAEAGISFQFKNKFIPHVQVGYAKVEPTSALENGEYSAEGKYARAGINYLLPLDAASSFYIGMRYAMSQFEETGSYEISSTLWLDRNETYSRKGLEADWFEVVFGSEKRIKTSNWFIGGTITLRILNDRGEKFSPIDTYAIPGYGRTFDKTVPALCTYIKYSF